MGSGPGHIELERALDSIPVGRRHRDDLGDIDQLADSIAREGLLQPITITPDGKLVCGRRRLAAMRKLGWKTANVWVRSGITDRLGELLAEQDDNALHKPLTLTEQATLYRELKQVMAEDAARRQEASRFVVGGPNPRGSDGGATVAPPSDHGDENVGKARVQAARMVSGRDAYTSLERINELQQLVEDESQTAAVRERAGRELEVIDAGGSITAAQQRTHAEQSLAELDRLAADLDQPADVRAQAALDAERLRAADADLRAVELERLAADALARLTAERKAKKQGKKPQPQPLPPAPSVVMSVRGFALTWDDLACWWERADPTAIGPALTVEQWERFTDTVAGTVRFMNAAATARRATTGEGNAGPTEGRARLHAV